MTAQPLPPFVKIKEYRLGIRLARENDPTRPLTRSRPYSVALAERWEGELLFAPLLAADAKRLLAALERLDGKVSPFALTLKGGVVGQASTSTAVLTAAPALGTDTLPLSVSGAELEPGTLVTVGDLNSGPFQLFEVLETTSAGVTVAPRVRASFSSSSPVAVGTVTAKFQRASDAADVADYIGHSLISLSIVEAL